MTHERRDELRYVIRGPVSNSTTILQQHEDAQRAMWRDWLDTLMPFHVDEVRQAFTDYRNNSNRPFLKPEVIVSLINQARAKAASRIEEIEAELETRRQYQEEQKRRAELEAEGGLEERRRRANEIMAGFKGVRDD